MGRGQKNSEMGRGEAFFCPRSTFRALSHLSRFDSRRSPRGKEETTRSLNLRIFCAKKQEKDRQMKSFELSETSQFQGYNNFSKHSSGFEEIS